MLIVLAGYSATGKDTYQNMLLEQNPNLKRALSATTRPIRPGETDGVEYHFLDGANYMHLLMEERILSERIYNTIQNGKDAVWRYGLLKEDFENSNWITILDHEGSRRVRNAVGSEHVKIVYMTCSDQELRARSRGRLDESAEYERRLADDKIQFQGIEEIYDLTMKTDVSMSVHESNIKEIEEMLR